MVDKERALRLIKSAYTVKKERKKLKIIEEKDGNKRDHSPAARTFEEKEGSNSDYETKKRTPPLSRRTILSPLGICVCD